MQRLSAVSDWLRSMGPEGTEFISRLADTMCREEAGDPRDARPAFRTFNTGAEFENKIAYGRSATQNPLADLFSHKVHEGCHAIQYDTAAVLYALPENFNSRYVLCPEDAVWLTELMEKDAVSTEMWFMNRLGKTYPELAEKSPRLAGFTGLYEFYREKHGDDPGNGLNKTLAHAAHHVFVKPHADSKGNKTTIQQKYHKQALTDYTKAMQIRQDRALTDVVFVRLGPEDIKAIGDSAGPNLFDTDKNDWSDPLSRGPPQLSEDCGAHLNWLNDCLGIDDKAALPTLGEALDADGLTHDKFMDRQRQRKVKHSRTSAPAQSR